VVIPVWSSSALKKVELEYYIIDILFGKLDLAVL
jgi:hypothetical protein